MGFGVVENFTDRIAMHAKIAQLSRASSPKIMKLKIDAQFRLEGVFPIFVD
jgi:hypothetical protein